MIQLERKESSYYKHIQHNSSNNKNANISTRKLFIFSKRNIIYIFLKIFIIICITRPYKNSSYINIAINKKGNCQVYSDENCGNKLIKPDEIWINGEKEDETINKYELIYNKNNITLVWNNEINSTACIFSGCADISEVDLSDFNSSKLIYMQAMFSGCKSLTSINLKNLDSSKVIDMHHTFRNCKNLQSLDLSNFNTSSVKDMYFMFAESNSLISLNLSNFQTSNVVQMFSMFEDCTSLSMLDISNFDTSSIKKISSMFKNCISLTSINLSHFKTPLVDNMINIFNNCYNLKFLDISNFDFSSTTTISGIFENCTNLEYLNLKNANIKTNLFNSETFADLSKNLVLCTTNDYLEKLERQGCSVIDCGESWRKTQKIIYNDQCYDNCSLIQLYEYNRICYESCPNGTYNNSWICEDCAPNCLTCLSFDNCILYKEGYQPTHNTQSTTHYNKPTEESPITESSTYSKYNNDPTEELNIKTNDIINSIQCYFSCEECSIRGNYINHNCISCKNEFPIEEIKSDFKNCYNYSNSTKIAQNLIDYFNSSENGKKISYKTEDDKLISIELINTYNEKNKETNNETSIDLRECEDILKGTYNISNDSLLYLLKIEVNQTGMKIPKIEYEIYAPLNDNKLKKLDLSVCNSTRVEVSIPVFLNDDIKKYDPRSDYYNDICTKTTSKYGTDICMKDRQNEFVENNMAICEENCYLLDYNTDNKKVKCSCPIKLNLPLVENIEIDKKQFFKSFTYINTFANIKMMKCIKDVIDLKELKNNSGFLIFFFIVFIFFISLFLFSCKFYLDLKKQIIQIFNAKKEIKQEREKEMQNTLATSNKILKYVENRMKRGNNKSINININTNIQTINKYRKPPTKYETRKQKQIKIDKNLKLKNNLNAFKNKRINKKQKSINKKVISTSKDSIAKIKRKEKSKIHLNSIENNNLENILKLNDNELNSLKYEEALKQDKRSFSQYYCSLLKTNHLIIFTFCNNTDYNSKVIKILLLLFSFSLNLTINALFFNDDTMHKIYIDQGSFNLNYQLPQILYSTLISIVISIIINKLALTEDDILKLKKEKNKNKLIEGKNSLMSKIKIKFIFFFILSFSFLISFWIFITCFCGVYKNTQIHLIKDSIIGFITPLLYPFGIYLIPGIFRICSLRAKKRDKKCLYILSKLCQMI